MKDPMTGAKKNQKKNRDDWCTPEWVWKLALKAANRRAFDVDPFSNELSTVPAKKSYLRKGGEKHVMRKDEIAWVNGPFSKVRFWFEWSSAQAKNRAHAYGIARFDPSTRAWKDFGPQVVWIPPLRVEYVPPPGIDDRAGPQFISALCLWSQSDQMHEDFEAAVFNLGGYLGLRD